MKPAIQEIILATVAKTNTASWADIVAAVNASDHNIKNWLTQVRGPLQTLIDAGKIKRDFSAGVAGPEVYAICNP